MRVGRFLGCTLDKDMSAPGNCIKKRHNSLADVADPGSPVEVCSVSFWFAQIYI